MTPSRAIIEARLTALHVQACRLIADGLDHSEIDREIARLEADNDELPIAANDTGEGEVA